MGIKFSLMVVGALIAVVFLGVKGLGLYYLFGVIIPYLAIFTFIGGFVLRIFDWARSPVPFRIPTTAGQQYTPLPGFKQNKLDCPSSTAGVIGRMALEVLLFRSLFRNSKVELRDGPKLTYQWEKWLWLAGLLFHWSFLIILIRHLRFFAEPVPGFVHLTETLDGILQLGLPGVYLTDGLFLVTVTYLFVRRVVIPQVK